MDLGEIVAQDQEALKIADALTPTTLKILRLLSQERLDVSTIALRLNLSEAYMSEQIKLLEELRLIKVNYERGKRGIRKICESAVKKITIVIKPDA
jgi:predicted transcriptional regulator